MPSPNGAGILSSDADRVRVARSTDRARRCRSPLVARGAAARLTRLPRAGAEIRLRHRDWRAEKDRFMRGRSESPVPASPARHVPAAALLPDRRQYRVPAACASVARRTTSSRCRRRPGKPRRMRRIGTLAFTLKGQPLTLTAFAEADDTAAAPAVRAVRRSDQRHRDLSRRPLPRSRSDSAAASTNSTSIAPTIRYCVFNPTYECPVPPRENRLQVPIRAGERMR